MLAAFQIEPDRIEGHIGRKLYQHYLAADVGTALELARQWSPRPERLSLRLSQRIEEWPDFAVQFSI